MAIKKKKISPRQKMINLMYVVLMAMLALNVSSDVLNGFSLVDESLNRSTENANLVNRGIYENFEEQYKLNPTKVKEWYDKAQYVRKISDKLYNLSEELKVAIVKKSDGEEGDIHNIRNREDLEAATFIMLAPGIGRGKELYDAIVTYRKEILTLITDPIQKRIIESNLSTDVPQKPETMGKNWQEYMFETMPTSAAVTLLTKLQNDVRYAEGEVLHSLVGNIGIKDIRVNELNAYVIPQSLTIVQGGKFSAQIVMAAIDTTNRPTIFVGGRELQNERGIYETICGSTGQFSFKGFVEMMNASGEKVRREFEQKYNVIAPAATVSADIMNVLYAGYDNPMSVSVPGVPTSQISLTMAGGGSLTPKGEGKYIAKPTQVGSEVTFTVSAQLEGRTQQMGQFKFRVRKLPDPTAFIAVGEEHFKGGRISKQTIMEASQLNAAIDDGLLNIPFRVTGFETTFFDNLGNVLPEISDGANFSNRQKNQIRQLSRGKRFYISAIRTIGPDGVERTLNGVMELIIN